MTTMFLRSPGRQEKRVSPSGLDDCDPLSDWRPSRRPLRCSGLWPGAVAKRQVSIRDNTLSRLRRQGQRRLVLKPVQMRFTPAIRTSEPTQHNCRSEDCADLCRPLVLASRATTEPDRSKPSLPS